MDESEGSAQQEPVVEAGQVLEDSGSNGGPGHGPAHGNRVQTLSTEPHGPAGLDLNILASLNEPEELMIALHTIAQKRNGQAWMIVDKAARQAIEGHKLLNQPEVA